MAPARSTLLLTTSEDDIERAGAILRAGGLVAMPTETVYGLAANALDAAAVESIFAAKERPRWDPLIVHLADASMLSSVALPLSPVARRLADAFWPGPLTMLLPRISAVPDAVTAGRDLVGVRIPAHPVAIKLIRAAGVPLAAPSANRFGRISPTSAEHVLDELDGRIAAVVDAGPSSIGVESTVLDPNTTPVTIYRQGGVSASAIRAITGLDVQVYQAEGTQIPQSTPSPGVGIRHYAPRAVLVLVEDEQTLRTEVERLGPASTGVMLPDGWQTPPDTRAIFRWGHWAEPSELAHRLYDGLRTLDGSGVSWIVCPLLQAGEGDLVEALRDRLRKAAMPKD